MEWEIIEHLEDKYIEILTKGIADNEGSLDMAKILSETLKNRRITRVLVDHRNIKGVIGKTTEIYDRPKILKLIGVIFGIKIAEIIKPEYLDHFKFLETVFINRGFKVAIFQERELALEWLLN